MTNSQQVETESEPEGTPLEIPAEIHEAMVAHCLRETPLECCGILGGVSSRVSSFHPLRNIAASETRYDADPQDLIQAWVWLREHGSEIAAIYHSHPRWAGRPQRHRPAGEPLRPRAPHHRVTACRTAGSQSLETGT